jgi:hypothetical protein
VSLSVIRCNNNPVHLTEQIEVIININKVLQVLSIESLNATVALTGAAQVKLSLCTFLSLALEASE